MSAPTAPDRAELIAALAEAREANRKLHRRCQRAERLETAIRAWSQEFEGAMSRPHWRRGRLLMKFFMRRIEHMAERLDRAALASEAASPQPVGEWQPIVTAPGAKNGLKVWVFGPKFPEPEIVDADGSWWRALPIMNEISPVSHWCPVVAPAAPHSADQEAGE